MAHFAKLSEENVVIQVEVVSDADCMLNGVEDEATGIAYLTEIHGWPLWKKCSYNTRAGKHYQADKTESPDQSKAFRKNYPSVGWSYNSTIDGFIPPQDQPSWSLNTEKGVWEAPVAFPTITTYETGTYFIDWDEVNQKWLALDSEDPQNNFEWNPTTLSWDSV